MSQIYIRINADLYTVDGAATVFRTTDAALLVRVQGGFVIDRYLFSRIDVAESDEEDVVVEHLHEGVRQAGMIDVVRAVASSTAIKAPAVIHLADAKHFSMRAPAGLGI